MKKFYKYEYGQQHNASVNTSINKIAFTNRTNESFYYPAKRETVKIVRSKFANA